MKIYKKMQRTNRIIPWLMLGVTLAGYGIWLYGLCTGYIRSIKGDDYLFQSVVSLLISSGLSMVILYIGYTIGESRMKTILKLTPNNLDLCYPIGHLSSLGVFALLYGMQCVTIHRNSSVNSPRQAVVDLDKLNCDGLCTLPDVRQRLIRLLKAPAPDRKISEKSVTLPLSEFAKVIEEALNQSKQTLLAGMTPTPRLSVFTFLCAALNVWLAPVMMITKLVFAFQRNKPSGILMMVLLFTIILCFYLTYVIHEAAYRWSQSSRLSFPKRKSSYGYAFKPFNSTAMTENERFELLRMAITSNNEQLLANSKALMTQQEHAFLHKLRYLSLYLQRVHMAADKAAHEQLLRQHAEKLEKRRQLAADFSVMPIGSPLWAFEICLLNNQVPEKPKKGHVWPSIELHSWKTKTSKHRNKNSSDNTDHSSSYSCFSCGSSCGSSCSSCSSCTGCGD